MEPESSTNFVFAELLPLIFTYLSTFDLLQCRLVRVQWKRVATQLLLKRGPLKITFRMDSSKWHKNHTSPTFSSISRFVTDLCEEHLKLKRREVEEIVDRRTLPSLFRLLTNSSLPVGRFEFRFQSSAMNRNQPQLISFLQVYGPKIRALTLENHPEYFVGHKGMPNFLLQYTPNLELLVMVESQDTSSEICPNFFLWKGSNRGQRPVTLPNLKFIHIIRGISNSRSFTDRSNPTIKILPHLLNIAPQLQGVSFGALFELNKMENIFHAPPCKTNLLCLETLTLTCGNLFFEGQENLENLAKTTMKNPKGLRLTDLSLDLTNWPHTLNSWKKGCWIVGQILGSNSNSIRHFRLTNQSASILRKIEGLPALPKVETLAVYLGRDYRFKYRAGGNLDFLDWISSKGPENSLSQLLPNLRRFVLYVQSWRDEELARQWFPCWNDRLTSVDSLRVNLQDSLSGSDNEVQGAETVDMSLKLCPNVSRFETTWPYCQFPLLLQPLYSMTQLTSLKLTFRNNNLGTGDTFFDLDAALTGLSKESVTTLYNNWERSGHWDTSMLKRRRVDNDEEQDKIDNWTVLRVDSSILELKNLRSLIFEFDFALNGEPRVLLSIVSGKLAFALMKSVEVRVRFNFYRGIPRCPDCACESPKKKSWLKLHQPLTSFSNVTVDSMY